MKTTPSATSDWTLAGDRAKLSHLHVVA